MAVEGASLVDLVNLGAGGPVARQAPTEALGQGLRHFGHFARHAVNVIKDAMAQYIILL